MTLRSHVCCSNKFNRRLSRSSKSKTCHDYDLQKKICPSSPFNLSQYHLGQPLGFCVPVSPDSVSFVCHAHPSTSSPASRFHRQVQVMPILLPYILPLGDISRPPQSSCPHSSRVFVMMLNLSSSKFWFLWLPAFSLPLPIMQWSLDIVYWSRDCFA